MKYLLLLSIILILLNAKSFAQNDSTFVSQEESSTELMSTTVITTSETLVSLLSEETTAHTIASNDSTDTTITTITTTNDTTVTSKTITEVIPEDLITTIAQELSSTTTESKPGYPTAPDYKFKVKKYSKDNLFAGFIFLIIGAILVVLSACIHYYIDNKEKMENIGISSRYTTDKKYKTKKSSDSLKEPKDKNKFKET